MNHRIRPPGPGPRILLTGATGYVGGRLLARLEAAGHTVRCMARRPACLEGRAGTGTEVVRGDVTDPNPDDVARAMRGVDTAFYLIHGLDAGHDFEQEERRGANHFALAAREAGVRRIIYLGGLARPGEDLSPHLRSRFRVGEILAASGVQVIELRASIIIGAGSLSFEMIRALVERLPVMITPRWVGMHAQPIAIDDVLDCLVASMTLDVSGNRIFECGGADRVSYGGIMQEYARQRGLRRIMIPVPVITPALSGLWLGVVTPVHARVGRKLIDSIRHASIVTDTEALHAFGITPRGIREAIADALRQEEVETATLQAGRPRPGRSGTRYRDVREMAVSAPPDETFAAIRRIGGSNGWYAHDALWRIRGWIDRLAGGVGARRGRLDPDRIQRGDAVDFWRVEDYVEGRLLRLRAEMKLPGRAWLQFEVFPEGKGSRLRQTACFAPAGLSGILYWNVLRPIHAILFRDMLKGIAAHLESGSGPGGRLDSVGPTRRVAGGL